MDILPPPCAVRGDRKALCYKKFGDSHAHIPDRQDADSCELRGGHCDLLSSLLAQLHCRVEDAEIRLYAMSCL